ncbi:MAG: hypothetical protein HS101_18300 [Planctomycetia bacterium]|nr:hypothetical protein [Planctomycetia bacterium]
MAISKAEIEPLAGLMEMGHLSLWFLSTALQQENWGRTVEEVYTATIGQGAGPGGGKPQVFNQGTCLMAAYLMFVVPKEALFKEFSSHLAPESLSLDAFTLTDGSGGPWNKPLEQTLNKLRNGIAHANVGVEPGTDELTIRNYPLGSKASDPPDFVAKISLRSFIAFVESYKNAWMKWADSLT